MPSRLTKSQWLDHGLKTLASSGPELLKAKPLSKSLGVTRGSFYWHFLNIDHFHVELLAHWQAMATDEVIDELEQSIKKHDRLEILLIRAMAQNQNLERAIRSWAIQSDKAAKAVDCVDKIRLDYLAKLFQPSEIDQADQMLRAKFIYWAYLGRMMTKSGDEDWDRNAIQKIANLLQT